MWISGWWKKTSRTITRWLLRQFKPSCARSITLSPTNSSKTSVGVKCSISRAFTSWSNSYRSNCLRIRLEVFKRSKPWLLPPTGVRRQLWPNSAEKLSRIFEFSLVIVLLLFALRIKFDFIKWLCKHFDRPSNSGQN